MRDRLNAGLRRLPVGLVWAGGALPLILLLLDLVLARLGADPLRQIEHRTGRIAIYFLVATLAVTPLLRLGRINLMRFRRVLGLLAFIYAALHLAAWMWFDRGLAWGQIWDELLHRPFLTIGGISAVILTILAATASQRAIRGLGARNWQRIHRGIYLAAPLAAWHWLASEKIPSPLAQAILAMILLLLGVRIWRVAQKRFGSL